MVFNYLEGMHPVVLFYKNCFKIVPVSAQQPSKLTHAHHCAIMSLFFSPLALQPPWALASDFSVS
jgi:hypothetical protein